MKPTGCSKKKIPNLTIAIVEDDSLIAIDMKNNLEESGYTVAGVYCSGEEAVINIPEIEPDLIVMDIYLNGVIDGIEAAERIMLMHNIPVVFITGLIDKIVFPRIYFTENYGILLKPFNRNELLNTIELVYNNYIRSIEFYQEYRELILINTNKTNFFLNQESRRSIHSIIEYADHLLNEIDNLDEEEIKNYIAKICIYLKVVLAADLNSPD